MTIPAIVLEDDVYFCLLVKFLDSGDTRTLTGATDEEAAKDDEIQPEDGTPRVLTRSGRRSAIETKIPTLSSTQ